MKRIEKTINNTESLNKITFDETLNTRIPPCRKQGRPKYKWADKTIEDYWKEVRKTYKFYNTSDYDPKNEKMKELMKIHAIVSTQVPKEIWEKMENKETKTKDEIRDRTEIALYTDGSCQENDNNKKKTQPAGWGVAVIEGRIDEEGRTTKEGRLTHKLYGPVITEMNKKYFLGTERASNNTGKLTAICEGLLWLKDYEPTNRPVAFYYDSKYASKITTGEFRANDNKHLAATARALLKVVLEQRTVRFEHVKGHSNDRWNDEADDLADRGAKGEQCTIGRYTQAQTPETNNNTNTNTNTEHTNKQREDIRKINNQRLINIRIAEKDKIQIPKPSYGHGSNIRSKFAFGKITKEQANMNTAKHIKETLQKKQNNTATDTTSLTEKEEESKTTEENETTEIPLVELDITLQQRIQREEEYEEDIFYGNDNPTEEDCA